MAVRVASCRNGKDLISFSIVAVGRSCSLVLHTVLRASEFASFFLRLLAPARRLWMRFNPTTKSSSNSV